MTDDPWADFKPSASATDPWADFVKGAPSASPSIPAAYGTPAQTGPMSISMPETDLEGFPTGRMLPAGPMNTMPYGEQMGHVGGAFLSAADRVAANLPFMDRGTAMLNAKTGQGDYDTELARIRADNEQKRKDNPVGEGLATAAGMALPVTGGIGMAARGVGMIPTMVRGAVAGGAIGGVQGVSDVQDLTKPTSEDAENVLKAAGTGAAVGASVPAVGAGLGKVYRAIADRLNGTVPGVSKPAQAVLGTALTGDNPAAVQQRLAELGPHAMPLDAGANLKGLAQGVMAPEEMNSPQARALIDTSLTQRQAGKNARVGDVLDTELGPTASPQMVTDALQAQRRQLHSGFPAVFAQTPNADPSSVLATVGQKLNTAVGTEAAVLKRVKNNLMETLPDGSLVPTNSAEKMHNTKMDLDSLIKKGDTTLGVPAGMFSKTQGTIGNIRQQLNGELRSQVPGYAAVNIPSSELAGTMDAIKAGKQNVLSGGPSAALEPAYHASQFQALPPAQQIGQRIGLRGNIDQAVGTKDNDLQAVRQILQGDNGWNSQKLATAFGQPQMDRVQNVVNAEHQFGQSYNDVVGNSKTAERLAMARALQQESTPPQPLIPNDLRNVTAIGGPLELGRKAVNAVHGAFRPVPDLAGRDFNIAQAVTSQGPQRDALIGALTRAHGNQGQNAISGDRLNYLTQLLLGNTATGALAGPRQSQ